jgi:SAM-dependent methyltransferase
MSSPRPRARGGAGRTPPPGGGRGKPEHSGKPERPSKPDRAGKPYRAPGKPDRAPHDEPRRRGPRAAFTYPHVEHDGRHGEDEGEGGERPAPRQRRAFSTMGGPVELGGDAPEARRLGKLLGVDPGLARALTHGFHSYSGRMHPTIARGAITTWSRAGDLVVDPFCGSGTVLVEAMGLGRRAAGIDASPLGVAIARVRSTVLGADGRARLVSEAARIAEESGDNARKRRRPETPPWAKREFERFHPHVALELLGLRALVMDTRDDDVGRALRLCLSSILVKLMKAGPEAPRDGEGKRIARGVPSRLFIDRAEELARGLAALEQRTPAGTPAPAIHLGDARDLGMLADGAAALVVSSPPYAGTYDYAAQHDVRFAWLELPRRTFRETQLGARSAGLGADPATWRAGQRRWIAEIARVLAPGGHAMLVVGDGVVGREPEDAPDAVAGAASPLGLEPIARASQKRPVIDNRLQEIFAARPRREHLLLLRKRG